MDILSLGNPAFELNKLPFVFFAALQLTLQGVRHLFVLDWVLSLKNKKNTTTNHFIFFFFLHACSRAALFLFWVLYEDIYPFILRAIASFDVDIKKKKRTSIRQLLLMSLSLMSFLNVCYLVFLFALYFCKIAFEKTENIT